MSVPPGYKFNPNWDYNSDIYNDALLYMNNNDLNKYFLEESLRFMSNNKPPRLDDNIKPHPQLAVFAEMSILTYCTKEKNLKYKLFINAIWNGMINKFIKNDWRYGEWKYWKIKNPLVTHLWHYKIDLQWDTMATDKYCRELLKIAKKEFPDFLSKLEKIPQMQPHLTKI